MTKSTSVYCYFNIYYYSNRYHDIKVSTLITLIVTLLTQLIQPSVTTPAGSGSSVTSSAITTTTSSLVLSEISGSKYKALIDGKVELPCNISSSTSNDAVTTIFWYKGDTQGSPIYTVDARNSSSNLTTANRFTSDYLKGRVSFNITVQFAFLIIKPVREEDNGAYRCRVDFRWSRTINTIVYLEVIVPAKKLIITDETNNQMIDSLGASYGEGTSLKLKCIAYGGKPAPSVHWYLDENLLDDTFTSKITEDGLISINELTILKLGRSHTNKLLSCKSFNTNLTQSINNSLTLDINLYPLYVKIISIKRPLSSSKSTELQCDSKGSRPGAKITWYLNNKLVTSSREMNSETNGSISSSSILKLVPSPSDNGALLSCKAENPRLLNSSIKDDWILNIYYKPNVKLVSRLINHQSEIKENDEIIFECIIDSNPGIKEIGWTFNEVPLKVDESKGIIIDNTTLVIKVADKSHSGDYSCYAFNIEGKGSSNRVTIKVNHSPVCVKDQKSIYIVGLGETIRVSCSIEAEPGVAEIIWKINDTQLEKVYPSSESSSSKPSLSSLFLSDLLYSPRRLDDYGTLVCSARNKIGIINNPCQFIVMPAGRPERMTECLVSNQTGESLTVSCTPGHNGGLNQTFYLQVYDYRREKLLFNLTSIYAPNFLVNGLTAGSNYIFDVYSSNPRGSSNTTTLVAQTLPIQKHKLGTADNLTEKKLDPYLVVFSALILTITLVAIIIILIIRIRNHEDKVDPKKKLKTIEPTKKLDNQGPDVINSTRYNKFTISTQSSNLRDPNFSVGSVSSEEPNIDATTNTIVSDNIKGEHFVHQKHYTSNNMINNHKTINCRYDKKFNENALTFTSLNNINNSNVKGEILTANYPNEFNDITVIKGDHVDESMSLNSDYQISATDEANKCIVQYIPFDESLNRTLEAISKLKLEPNYPAKRAIQKEYSENDDEYTFSTPV